MTLQRSNRALRAVLAIALGSAAVSCVAQAPLRSPWDGKHVAVTNAPYDCPKFPDVGPDLTTDGFYRKDDPTHSIVDPVLMDAYTRSAGPVKKAGQELVGAADAFRTTGSRGAAQCALTQMSSMARQHSLTGRMSSGQAYYVQGWIAGAIAIAYLKVLDSGLATAQDRTAIPAWLEQVGAATRQWYDDHAAKSHNPLGNNHLYWAGVELAAIATAANDRKNFDWAMSTYENGVAQIKPDGTLPLEMARGTRALHYHLYALAPLVLLAEFGEANGLPLYSAHDGAIHRLEKVSIAGLSDPSIFVAGTGRPQEPSTPVSGDAIGWAPPYLARFPDPTLAGYVKRAASLSVFYLGGLPPS